MDDIKSKDLDLQIVELGDAKVVTKGTPAPVYAEDNPQVQAKD